MAEDLAPRLGDDAPIIREDDVERCDFGAAEIAGLRAERNALRRYVERLSDLAQSNEHISLHEALDRADSD